MSRIQSRNPRVRASIASAGAALICLFTSSACSGASEAEPVTAPDPAPSETADEPSTPTQPPESEPGSDPDTDSEDPATTLLDVPRWQSLLDAYVTEDGGVRYEALRSNAEHVAELDHLVEQIGAADVGSASRDERLAFYINAYNILTMHTVLARWPINSVMQPPGFFDQVTHRIAGEERTLNGFEGEVIRGQEFSDPRIHFAVNCASAGCPPLSRQAFTAENLESRLSALADSFVRATSRIDREGGRVQVTQLFEWYADDFGGADGVRTFVADHLEGEDAVFVRETSTAVTHFDYDWALNRRD